MFSIIINQGGIQELYFNDICNMWIYVFALIFVFFQLYYRFHRDYLLLFDYSYWLYIHVKKLLIIHIDYLYTYLKKNLIVHIDFCIYIYKKACHYSCWDYLYAHTQVMSMAFEQKNPKNQQEALTWLTTAIQEFGLK